ncbi:MAG: hypothetical protein IRZ24_16940 [Thermogemmatispora sp.]|uniref:hypothetical protein n=1 Tax=Thermogemmatispora sp. TaxID=1968838 RepID=UPI001DD26D7E|nr:hypothetical protein [Thermogemmatispora sp.]MBX5451748.1 hypothetical protein [Thermogemmatispora sp.]
MGWRTRLVALRRALVGHEDQAASQPGPADRANQTHPTSLPSGVLEPDVGGETYRQDLEEHASLERYRRQIDEFDEDREPLLGRLIRQVLVAVAYVGPLVVAWVVGLELGDAFAGGGWRWDSYNVGMHVVSLLAELLTGGLALASAHALKKVLSDRAYLARCVSAVVLFVLLSGGSCMALWWVISQHGDYPLWVQLSRVILGPCVDVGAIVVLATLEFRSLAKHLQTIHQKADAIHQLAEAEIRLREAEQAALNRQREAEQFLEARRLYEETLAEMSKLQMRGTLKMMERVLRVVETEPLSTSSSALMSPPPKPLSLLSFSQKQEQVSGDESGQPGQVEGSGQQMRR